MNLPNKITISRIVLVPIFVLFIVPIPQWLVDSVIFSFCHNQLESWNLLVERYGNYIAAVFFIIASSTDGVDGYIARKRKQVTRLGIFLDPIADKLLTTAALVALVERGDVTTWSAIIIIARDLIVTGLRLVASGEGVVIAASTLGKIKTITQMIAISLSLLKNFPLDYIFPGIPFDRWTMFIAVVITIYSGYDYLKKNVHLIELDKT